MGKFPPNHYQQDIIDWVVDGEGNAVVNALAGTGKTSTLELVASTYPKKMLFLAFNNHIAAELNEKPELQHYLKKKEEGGAATLKVMTVNSLGNMAMQEAIRNRDDLPYKKDGYLKPNKLLGILGRIIRTYCDTRHEKVNEDMIWTMQRDLKVACDKARSKYVKDDRDTIQRVIDEDNLCQFNIPTGDDTQDQVIFPILPWAQICEEALEMSMAMYEERGDYDFVEQLYIPVVKNLPFPAWLAWYSSFIAVDEAQDLSKLQLQVVKKLIPMKLPAKFGVKDPTRYLFVGDAHQCQPAGTKVLMADKTEKNIEDLQVGDKVIQYFTGKPSRFSYKNNFGIISDIQKNKSNKLIKFTTINGKVTQYTPNHRCYAKLNTDKGWIVYIMMNEAGFFRVGKTRIYRTSGSGDNCDIAGFGLKLRMRQEKCKFGWALKYCENEKDAWVWEQIISLKYGIPQIIFHYNDTKYTKQDALKIFDELGQDNLYKNLERCLNDFGRDLDYPLCTTGDYKNHIAKTHSFEIRACNIMPEIMDFLVYDEESKVASKFDKKQNKFYSRGEVRATYEKIVQREDFNGEFTVYGLKVDSQETYVADGIMTHNCIYAFAGADCHSIDNIKRQFKPSELPLNICYRCAKKIIQLAQQDVPAIEAAPDAKEGEIHTIRNEEIAELIQPRRYGNSKEKQRLSRHIFSNYPKG